jgi:PleD family two-component response regulator
MTMPLDRRVTLLFIDSHNTERNHYANQLKELSSDYRIYHAASGQTGLSICQGAPIDFVVLEMNLEDMSGFEVLGKLMSNVRYRGITVLVLTHLTNPFLLEMAVKNGARTALCKSFTSADLLHKHILKAISARRKIRKPLVLGDAALPPPFAGSA